MLFDPWAKTNYVDNTKTTMASFSAQMCLQCQRLIFSRTTVCAWVSTHFGHCSSSTWTTTQLLNRSLTLRGSLTTAQSKEKWRQGPICVSNLTAKHLSERVNDSEELSRANVAAYRSPLLPVRDTHPSDQSQMSLDHIPDQLALEEITDNEAVSITLPPAMPPASTSLRDYVDQSETLSKLVQLGVDLWKLEQRPNVGSMLLRLDFNKDVAPRLLFLNDIGVDGSHFGKIITQNPFILTESLENLNARVNYLKSKKFTPETVASMVSKAPYLLSFSVKRLDNRLGFFQQKLSLSAPNTRNIVARLPRLLCGSLEPIKENLKVCEMELGFKGNEIQHMVIAVPKVLTANKRKLTQIFDYLHNTMKVPHHLITKFPQVLNTKYLRIRERHMFLDYLGKAQYDPTLPNYIPLDRLVSLTDDTFCTTLAMATLEDFTEFQKTI